MLELTEELIESHGGANLLLPQGPGARAVLPSISACGDPVATMQFSCQLLSWLRYSLSHNGELLGPLGE